MKRSCIYFLLIVGSLCLNSCKKDVDVFTPQTVLEHGDLTEYIILTAEGKQLLATDFSIKPQINDVFQLSASFQSDSVQNEFVHIKFNIPQNQVGAYSLMGVPFELLYKGKAILDWNLTVVISEFGLSPQDKISGKMTGTISVAGTGTIPIALNFSVKRA